MKKNLRFLLLAFLAIISMNTMATEWVFDFNKMSDLSMSWAKNDTEEASTAGDITSVTTIMDETNSVKLEISAADEGKTANRFWRTSNGPQLRMYSGTFVISGVTAKSIVFDATSKFNITASEGTLEGKTWTSESGSSQVTFTVNANTQINKITVSSEATIVTPEEPEVDPTPTPTGDVKEGTCEDIMAAADGEWFRVTGTCIEIKNTTYGNWTLQDATGEVYIYGTLDAQGNTKNFASLGIAVGDIVTVEGPKKTYNETIELVDVKVINIVKGQGTDPVPVTESGTVFDFDANGMALLGLPGESSGSGETAVSDGDITETKTATVGAFSVAVSAGVPNEEGNVAIPNRLWNSSPKLRMYSGTLTVSSATDDIKTIVITLASQASKAKWGEDNTVSTGAFDASAKTSVTWAGNAKEVVFTIAKNTQISKITINGEAEPINPDPQPVTVKNVNVAEAIEVINALGDGEKTSDDYIVKGYVVAVDEISTEYGNATFDIADEKGGQVVLKVYRSKGLGGEKIGDENYLKLDDLVEVKGKLQKYVKNEVTTPEIASGGEIVSINGEVSGIHAVKADIANAPVYNLQGVRVQKTQKGLYIVNGRKYVVK